MIRNEKGVALIMALWVLAVLVVMALGIGTLAHTEARVARNQVDIIRCRWAARAGIYRAIAELETEVEDQSTYLYLGEDGLTLDSSSDSTIDIPDYEFSVTVEDESGKTNLNHASETTLTNLFDSTEMAECVIDWRDSDDTVSTEGAESEYYEGLSQPYECRNGDLQTLKELQLVKGFDEDTLSSEYSDGVTLADMLTVYTQSTSEDTSSQVDIQTGSQSELSSALGSVLSNSDIQAIINYRRRSSFTSPSQIVRVPGLTRAKIEEIYDLLKVSTATTHKGLVNINTASVDTLAVQENLDEDIAQAIVNYRADNGAFEGVGYLLAVSEVTNDVFEQAAPYFTVRSKVFRITSTGKRTGDEASASITCVVDLSGTTPQIRYWQE